MMRLTMSWDRTSVSWLDDEGFPAWVTSLVGSTDDGIDLYLSRGLPVTEALREAGAPDDQIQPVTLSASDAVDQGEGLLAKAVAAQAGDVHAWLGFEFGEWAVVIHEGMPLFDDPTAQLSENGREALSCSSNIEGDTHLTYAVDGAVVFNVTETIHTHPLDDLPQPLRSAAARINAPTDIHGASPADNFRFVSEFSDLHITLDDLRRLPLLGAKASID
jgi:hypothetical protein